MKLSALIILASLSAVCSAQYPSIPYNQTSVSYMLDIKDTSSKSTVEAINAYQAKIAFLNLLQQIDLQFNDRITYELHCGGGGVYSRANEMAYESFSIGIKFNLTNPKIAAAGTLLSKIHTAHNYYSANLLMTDSSLARRLIGMENSINDYRKSFFRRISIQILFPFARSITGYRENDPYHRIEERAVLAMGVDIKDIITLSVGSTFKGDPYAGISVDVSTPVYSYAASGINAIANFFNTSSGAYSSSGLSM